MADWFASGRIIDLVLALVVLEVAALPWLLKGLNSSIKLSQLLPNIVAGMALMLALRFSLTDASWTWIALAMLLALAAHLTDLTLRIRAGS